MRTLLSNLGKLAAIAAIGWPIWHWYKTGFSPSQWATTDFLYCALLIGGILFLWLKGISD